MLCINVYYNNNESKGGKVMKRVKMIDTRQGTRNQHHIGHGNTLPYTGVPFGMNHFVMQTRWEMPRFFHPDDYTALGVRLTHQPSPWMGDFCYVVMNQLGVTEEEWQKYQNSATAEQLMNLSLSSYRPNEAVFQPHYLAYQRLRDGLIHRWVIDEKGAKWQTEQTRPNERRLMTLLLPENSEMMIESNTVKIVTRKLSGSKYQHFQEYVVLTAFCDISYLYHVELDTVAKGHTMWVFEICSTQKVIEMECCTSYISFDQVQINRQQSKFYELSFTKACALSEQLWENYLNKIEVSHQNTEYVSTFYHCLWRTATFPQMAYELTEQGKIVHFSPYTNQVEEGYFFTNNGYWDTFRTNYPLYSLIIPSMIPKFIQGILSVVREDKFLPKWLSPDERGLMPGTLVDAVIADAVVKKLVSKEEAEELLEAIIYTAEHEGEHPTEGREGIKDYQRLGYLPANYHESVNKTLDYAYSDFCIAQVARTLGKDKLADFYEKRSESFANLFYAPERQMRPRTKDGDWITTISSYRWGEFYTEGSAWQNSLSVFHNIGKLIELYGGDEEFCQYLNDLINQDPVYDVGGYGYEIHEMTEMAKISFGQLALSNQPSFHVPYLYSYAGYPHFSHLIIYRLLTTLFGSDVEGYIGDEDNGSLSAWYVLSSLGLYSVTPGVDQWTLGISLWHSAIIHLENGHTVEIKNMRYPYAHLNIVQSRKWHNKEWQSQMLSYDELMQGGVLQQFLGTMPSMKKIPVDERAFSLNWHQQRRSDDGNKN